MMVPIEQEYMAIFEEGRSICGYTADGKFAKINYNPGKGRPFEAVYDNGSPLLYKYEFFATLSEALALFPSQTWEREVWPEEL